jgi:hypothetical protein
MTRKAKRAAAKSTTAKRSTAKRSRVQGEGDYEATRRYRSRTEKFLATRSVRKAAARAAPRTRREAEDMRAAEAAGRRRAKGEDPALRRRSAPRVEPSTRGRGARN